MNTTPNQAAQAAQVGPMQRRMDELRLFDDAHMVRRAMEAVRCLAMGSGERREFDSLDLLDREDLVALLEIITDRLGLALEKEEARCNG